MKPLVALALKFIMGEEGVEEVGRSNWGDAVSQFLAAVGWTTPAPWCCALACWSIREACRQMHYLGLPVPMTASCELMREFARSKDLLFDTPQPGDLMLVLGSNGLAHHTGMVQGVDGNLFWTVEGNSNQDGSAEGFEVVPQHRTVTPGHFVFFRWGALVDDTESYALYVDGKKLWDMPVWDGHANAPARVLYEAMGFTVDWDDADHAVTVKGGALPATVNGMAVPVEVTEHDVDGKGTWQAFGPVRDLAAAVNAPVAVDVDSLSVHVGLPQWPQGG